MCLRRVRFAPPWPPLTSMGGVAPGEPSRWKSPLAATSCRRAMQERLTFLGRLPSQPIFKLRTCEGSSAGPSWESSPKRSHQEAVHGAIPKGTLRAGVSTLSGPEGVLLSLVFGELWDRVAWAFCGPLLVSSTGDAGCSENVPGKSKC